MVNIYPFFKRFLDIVSSSLGLLILSPLILIISLMIKITSEGPILFKQDRLGQNGNVYKILKFRTMVVNAEQIGDGLTVKDESDPRITKLGSFLRSTSLDELPQLFNVIIGEMSIVGPRPPVTYFPYDGYEKYPKWAKDRFSMKPGITGLSQITVRNSVSWDQRMKVDLEYVKRASILLDIKIVILTIPALLKRKNIYGG